jgi:AcrR family transcriptional regulator
VFEERGYRDASIADIVARAKTARGTFYLYFRNKEDVFAAVLAEGIDEVYRSAGRAQPDIEAAIAGWLRTYSERIGLWRCTVEAALESPAAAAHWRKVRERYVARIARRLRAEQADGVARPVDADVAARALASMVEWYAFTTLALSDSPDDPEWLERSAAAMGAIWHHAVHPDQPA